jgi:hypothetical protein
MAARFPSHGQKDHIDPVYSAHYVADSHSMQEQEGAKLDWDIDEIEEANAKQERNIWNLLPILSSTSIGMLYTVLKRKYFSIGYRFF